ncbi:hypothetical protein V475_17255 [Sphingobium baderi LL03]|uniref:Uncharacterized protein n=2 Tax=Sphingobium baderi TaxID=1332080 RepID=T0HHG3_9SPHN|nr:hypothetical protein L485_23295 [Sphingobium baderi LL03]KMS64208.1 hypothetical protein V475_17255 [Sphingobium baderi LL03]
MSRISFALAVPALLSSCATASPESRLRNRLMEVGLPPRMAACMSGRMVDKLTLAQLRKLQSLASLRRAEMAGITLDVFLHNIRALEDSDIFVVTSKAAISCSL